MDKQQKVNMNLIKQLYLLVIITVIACAAESNAVSAIAERVVPEDILNPWENMDMAKETDPILGKAADFKITLENANMSGYAKLMGFYFDQNFYLDSAEIKGNLIHFKKDPGYPQGMYYVALPGNVFIQIILAENQTFDIKLDPSNIVGTIVVNGCEENQVFYQTVRFEEQINPKINNIAQKMNGLDKESSEYKELKLQRQKLEDERRQYLTNLQKKHPDLLFTKFKIGGQNPIVKENLSIEEQVYHYRKEFWDNVDFSDRRLLRTPMIGNKMKRYIQDITPQHHDSLFAAAKMLADKLLAYPEYYKTVVNWIVLKYEPGKCSLMDAEALFVNMVKRYFTHERAFWADSIQTAAIQKRAYEMSSSLIGQKAQNIISVDPDGQKQELYKKTADYLIVYIYNPDCEHCQVETPKLHRYYLQNKNEIDVFAVAVDTDDTKWRNYIKKNNLTWTNVFDPTNRSIYAKYWVDITPEIYVLNKDRIIIGKNLKTDQIQIIIDRDKGKSVN